MELKQREVLMTEKQLIAACKRADRENERKDRERVKQLAKAMQSSKFKFYAWELEEVTRLVHGAYGRMKLAVGT